MKTTKENSSKDTAGVQKNVIDGLNKAMQPMAASYDMAELFPSVPDSSWLLVGTGGDDFMASRFAHAVEDVDATLLNLNVMDRVVKGNKQVVALRVNHRDPERVARSLERYGYNVLESRNGDGRSVDSLSERFDELMRYLSV